MAEWKKVVVSGSNISQLANDSNYLIDGQAGAVLSGSFSGSFFGDGSGLTGLVASNAFSLTDGNGIADFTYDGSSGATVAIELSGSAPGLVVGAAGLAVGVAGIQSKHIAAGAVTLGDQTTGNYAAAVAAGPGINVDGSAGEGTTFTVSVDSGSLVDYLSGSIFAGISGDITISAGGVATIAADSVALGTDTTGNYVATIANATNGGVTVSNSGTETAAVTLALNLNDLSAAAVDVASDSIAIVDATDNSTKKESIADLVSGIAGTNLTATSGVLSLSSTITGSHTFNNNVTIQGNLTVEGTQINANVANLDIEDRYILLNSGSATVGDSGIVFGGSNGAAQAGAGLVWDASYNSNDGRLGIVADMNGNATGDQTIAYHIAGVFEGTAASAATAQADHVGNIRVESSEIYIYV